MDEQEAAERRCREDRRQNITDRRGEGNAEDEQDLTDRRAGKDRRQTVIDRRLELNRHRGPGKRRNTERKAAEEGEMSDEQFEFLMAVDEYKRKNLRPFPTWTEVLELIKAIGYRKVAEPQPFEKFQSQKEQMSLPS